MPLGKMGLSARSSGMYAMPNPASAALSIWSVMLTANCGLQSAIQ